MFHIQYHSLFDRELRNTKLVIRGLVYICRFLMLCRKEIPLQSIVYITAATITGKLEMQLFIIASFAH